MLDIIVLRIIRFCLVPKVAVGWDNRGALLLGNVCVVARVCGCDASCEDLREGGASGGGATADSSGGMSGQTTEGGCHRDLWQAFKWMIEGITRNLEVMNERSVLYVAAAESSMMHWILPRSDRQFACRQFYEYIIKNHLVLREQLFAATPNMMRIR